MIYKIDGKNATEIAKALNRGGRLDSRIKISQRSGRNGKTILSVNTDLLCHDAHKIIHEFMFYNCRTIYPLKLEPIEKEKKDEK